MQLVSVGAHRTVAACEPNTGVVDENVEPVVVALDRLGEGTHLGVGSEICGIEAGATYSVLLDLVDQRLTPLAGSAVYDDMRASGGEPAGQLPTQTACGARDEDHLSLLLCRFLSSRRLGQSRRLCRNGERKGNDGEPGGSEP